MSSITLDSKGGIVYQIGQAKAMAEFIGAIIAMATHPDAESDGTVKCMKKECNGKIIAANVGGQGDYLALLVMQ